jgi:hypothetical protein
MITLLASCAAPIPRPTDADVLRAASQRPQTTLAELERGRTLYVSRCGNCHRPIAPERLAPTAWPGEVDKMAVRAKLGTDHRELILLFLVTLSSRRADNGPAR